MVRAKSVLTASRHQADFFEEFIRKIAASPKDFQRSAHVSSRSLLNSANQELDIRE
jgi:hypothetical protein